MSCEDRTLQINAFLDGALSPPEAAALTAHLTTCPSCGQMLHELAALRAAMAELDVDEVPSAELVARVHALVDAPPGKVPGKVVVLRPYRRMAAGLAVSAALAATLLLLLFPGKDVRPDLMSVRDAALRVSVSETAETRAPAVPGFTLISARQDQVAGHLAQVAVYRRAAETITLCSWPAGREPAHGVVNAVYRGMAISYWNDGRTEYWAASNAPRPALPDFVRALHGALNS
jgi:anti-sigma factor RsiW